jgi:hypothetical protein
VQWSLTLQPGPPELEGNIRIERGPGYEASNSSSIHGNEAMPSPQPGRGTPRGTFRGLDAHANSSAPVPLWMVELDGRIVLRLPHGRRTLGTVYCR